MDITRFSDAGCYAAAGNLLSPLACGKVSSPDAYDADGIRVTKGTISTMSCNLATNGFQPTNDYILGPSGEQLTEMQMDSNNTMAWQHSNVFAAGKLMPPTTAASQRVESHSAVCTFTSTIRWARAACRQISPA
jgi:hypothetical protein